MANVFFPIESYKGGCDTNFNALRFSCDHVKYRKSMILRVKPVEKRESGMISEIFDFSDNPLTAGLVVASVPMERKNQKRIDAALADLCGLSSKVCDLWNKRDFDGIKALFS